MQPPPYMALATPPMPLRRAFIDLSLTCPIPNMEYGESTLACANTLPPAKTRRNAKTSFFDVLILIVEILYSLQNTQTNPSTHVLGVQISDFLTIYANIYCTHSNKNSQLAINQHEKFCHPRQKHHSPIVEFCNVLIINILQKYG